MDVRQRAALVVIAVATACDGSGTTLLVDVKTDLVPEVEFVAVRVELLADDLTTIGREDTVASRSADYLSGVRAAELESLTPGSTATVRVSLLAVGGAPRVGRVVRVSLAEGANGVTVLVTRDCEGVACPGAGDTPAAVACLGGACVDPACSEEHPELCPVPECAADGDCPGGAACGDARCISGTCTLFGDDARCAPMEFCHPISGCRPRGASLDGGSDGGTSDACVGAACGWWDPRFTRRNEIRLDNGTGPDLSDFPVLVPITSTLFDVARMAPDGADLRFVDGAGTILPHEIERWDAAGGSLVWVRVPSIPAGSVDERIYAHYGYDAPSPIPAAVPPTEVWSGEHVLVHHGADGRDSTANGNHGTTSAVTAVTGPVGTALGLDAASMSHVRVTSSASLESLSTAFTISAIVFHSGTNDAIHSFVSRQAADGGQNDFWLGMQKGTYSGEVVLDGVSVALTTAAAFPAGAYQHLALTWDGTTAHLFRDGTEVSNARVEGTFSSTPAPVLLGADRNGLPLGGTPDADFFSGTIDEVRIERIARSSGWLRAARASAFGELAAIAPFETAP